MKSYKLKKIDCNEAYIVGPNGAILSTAKDLVAELNKLNNAIGEIRKTIKKNYKDLSILEYRNITDEEIRSGFYGLIDVCDEVLDIIEESE